MTYSARVPTTWKMDENRSNPASAQFRKKRIEEEKGAKAKSEVLCIFEGKFRGTCELFWGTLCYRPGRGAIAQASSAMVLEPRGKEQSTSSVTNVSPHVCSRGWRPITRAGALLWHQASEAAEERKLGDNHLTAAPLNLLFVYPAFQHSSARHRRSLWWKERHNRRGSKS